MPARRPREDRIAEALKGLERRLKRLEGAVGRLTKRLDRLSTRRRKEAAKERGLRLRLEGLEARVSRAIASLERKVEWHLKELADSLSVNFFEAQLREVAERIADVERKVSALEGEAPAAREVPPIPAREVRATRWAVGVRAPGGKRWITVPLERFFRMCGVVARLGKEKPFTARDVFERMPELKELKGGMFQTRAAVSAMELLGLIRRVGKGENGSRLYSPAVPVDGFVEEAERKVRKLIAMREGREAAGLEERAS